MKSVTKGDKQGKTKSKKCLVSEINNKQDKKDKLKKRQEER